MLNYDKSSYSSVQEARTALMESPPSIIKNMIMELFHKRADKHADSISVQSCERSAESARSVTIKLPLLGIKYQKKALLMPLSDADIRNEHFLGITQRLTPYLFAYL